MLIHSFSKTYQDPSEYQLDSNQSGKIIQQLKNHNNKHVNQTKKILVVNDQPRLIINENNQGEEIKNELQQFMLQFKTIYQDHLNSGSKVDKKIIWSQYPKNGILSNENPMSMSNTDLKSEREDDLLKKYLHTIQENYLQDFQQNRSELNAVNQYKQYILGLTDAIQRQLDGEINSCLYLKQVDQDYLQPFIVSPAVIAVNFAIKKLYSIDIEDRHNDKEQRKQLPKITFINMDGFDSIANIKIMNENKQVQYISLFDDEMYDINFGQNNSTIREMYNEDQAKLSQDSSLIKTIINQFQTNQQKKNQFFYPFYSLFLLMQYANMKNHSDQKITKDFNYMNQRITSNNFYYIFSKVIQRLISNHCPDIIIISYTMSFNKYTHQKRNRFQLSPKKMQAIFKLLNKENPQATLIFIPRIIQMPPEMKIIVDSDKSIFQQMQNLFKYSTNINELVNKYKNVINKFSIDLSPLENIKNYQTQNYQLQTKQYIFSICASFLNILSLQKLQITSDDFVNSHGQISQPQLLFLHQFFRTMKAMTLLYNDQIKFLIPSNSSLTMVVDLIKIKMNQNIIAQSNNSNFKQIYNSMHQLINTSGIFLKYNQQANTINPEDSNSNLNELTQNKLFEKLSNQPKFRIFKKLLNYNYRNSLTICLPPSQQEYKQNPKLVQVKFNYINRQNISTLLEIAHPVQYYVDYIGERVFFFNVLDNGDFRNLVYNISEVFKKYISNLIFENYTVELPNDWNFTNNKTQLLIDFTMVMQEQQYLYIIWGLLYNIKEFFDNAHSLINIPQKSNNIFRINLSSPNNVDNLQFSQVNYEVPVESRIFSSAIYIQEQNINYIYIFGGITDPLASFAVSSVITVLSFDQSNKQYKIQNLQKNLIGPDTMRGFCRSIPLRVVNPIQMEIQQNKKQSQQQQIEVQNNQGQEKEKINNLLTGMYIFGGSFSQFLLDQSTNDNFGYIFFKGSLQKTFRYGLKKVNYSDNRNLKNFIFSSQNYNILTYINDQKVTYVVISEHVKKNLIDFVNIKKEKIYNFNQRCPMDIIPYQQECEQQLSSPELRKIDPDKSRLMVCYIKLSFQLHEQQASPAIQQGSTKKKLDYDKLQVINYENSQVLYDNNIIVSFKNQMDNIILYNDVTQVKKIKAIFAQVFFKVGGNYVYIYFPQSQKKIRYELVLDREEIQVQDQDPNNKLQFILHDFHVDNLFVDDKVLYALSQGTIDHDTLGSTHIYYADISKLDTETSMNEINELKFKPLYAFQQILKVQKESSIVINDKKQLFVLGGIEKRIYCDIKLLDRELSIPYQPRNSIDFYDIDFQDFYEQNKNEEKIKYMRFHQKEITEINLMNCRNILYFFINFLAQSNISQIKKLLEIYNRLLDEIAYPDMGLNLRQINLEEFREINQQQLPQAEGGTDQLINKQIQSILVKDFARHFKYVDNFSLRKVKCDDPNAVLRSLSTSGLKIQSLDISQFISFPSCGLPYFELETMAYVNRHCKDQFLEEVQKDIDQALKQLQSFVIKKNKKSKKVIEQKIAKEMAGLDSIFKNENVKQIKREILRLIYQYEFSDFFKNLVSLRMQNTQLNPFIIDILYYIYKPTLTQLKQLSIERGQERETDIPQSVLSSASTSNYKFIKYAIKLIEVDFSNFSQTENSKANNLDTQSMSKLFAMLTPYAQKIIMHQQSETQFAFMQQQDEIIIYNQSSLLLDPILKEYINNQLNNQKINSNEQEPEQDPLQLSNLQLYQGKTGIMNLIKNTYIKSSIQTQLSSTQYYNLNQQSYFEREGNYQQKVYNWYYINYNDYQYLKNYLQYIDGFIDLSQEVKIASINLYNNQSQTIYYQLKDIYKYISAFPNVRILINIRYTQDDNDKRLQNQTNLKNIFHQQIENIFISLPIKAEVRQTNGPLHIISDSQFNMQGFSLIQNTINDESISQVSDFSLQKEKEELAFQIIVTNQQNNYLCIKDQAFSPNRVQIQLDNNNQNNKQSVLDYIFLGQSNASFSQISNYQIYNDQDIKQKYQSMTLLKQDIIENLLQKLKQPYMKQISDKDCRNQDYIENYNYLNIFAKSLIIVSDIPQQSCIDPTHFGSQQFNMASTTTQNFAHNNLCIQFDQDQLIQKIFFKNIRDINKSISFCQGQYILVFQQKLLIENRSLNRYKIYFEVLNIQNIQKVWIPGYVVFENEDIDSMDTYDVLAIQQGQLKMEFIIVLDTSIGQDHEIFCYNIQIQKEHLESNDSIQIMAISQFNEGIYMHTDTVFSIANNSNSFHQNLIFNETNLEIISLTQDNQ